MASVVSGIEIPSAAAVFAFFARLGVFTAGAAVCDAAAVAVLSVTSGTSPKANAVTRATSFHRICMKNLCGMNHIAGISMPPPGMAVVQAEAQ